MKRRRVAEFRLPIGTKIRFAVDLDRMAD